MPTSPLINKCKNKEKLSWWGNIDDNCLKSFYSYVQNKTKIKSNVGPLLKQNGEITSDYIEMTELIYTYFSSVFSAEGDGPIPTLSRLSSEETLLTTFFDESDIIEKIDKMKPTTSPGTDGITSTILKELKTVFVNL